MKKDRFRKGAIISLSCLWLITFALYALNVFSSIEYMFYDTMFQRVSPVDTRIVVIGIDEDSISRIGQWPWPRGVMADVVDMLSEGGAAAIGIDVLFDTQSREAGEDERLAESIENAGNVTLPVQAIFRRKTTRVTSGHTVADGLILPFDAMQGVRLAHVNSFAESDGVVRRALHSLSFEEIIYPSFAYRLFEDYRERFADTDLQTAVPIDGAGRYYISYTGRSGWYHPVSFADVYEGKVPAAYFRDKIVLIGLYAQGIARDWHFTSIDKEHATYGVEIHANMVQQFLEGRFIRDLTIIADVSLFVLFTVCCALLLIRLRPIYGLLSLAMLLMVYGGTVYLLLSFDLVAQITYAPIFCVLAYFTSLIWHYARTRAEEARIRSTFGKYMAPDVVKKVLDEGEAGLKLHGQRRGVTVLFADIRGFTPLSERLEPEEVVRVLNGFLDIAASCVHRHGGTLDKFIGDAAMAIWNAPYDVDNHALSAVHAAMDMRRESALLEQSIADDYGEIVGMGFGINSGDAIIGNIGANFRMDYTAIGDTVNTAARLESNAKRSQILISGATAGLLDGSDVPISPLGMLKVKGKDEEVEVYEVGEEAGESLLRHI